MSTIVSPGLTLRGVTSPLSLKNFGLIAFDMDSTLINIECVDEIAAAAGRKDEVAAITEAMVEHAGAGSEHLHVIIHDVAKESWGRDGLLGIDNEPDAPAPVAPAFACRAFSSASLSLNDSLSYSDIPAFG